MGRGPRDRYRWTQRCPTEEAEGTEWEVIIMCFEEGLDGVAVTVVDESDDLTPLDIEWDVAVKATGLDEEGETDDDDLRKPGVLPGEVKVHNGDEGSKDAVGFRGGQESPSSPGTVRS